METAWLSELSGSATPIQVIAVRMLAAVVLCAPIGYEREIHGKAAGSRTHMLVPLASAAFVLIGYELAHIEHARGYGYGDPSRIIQGVITGIGFLGGGAILTSKGNIKGLSTAAGIWGAGAIGIACGAGFFLIAALLAFLIFSILGIIGTIEHRAGFGNVGDEEDRD